MFATVADVKEITGYDVDVSLIYKAQVIIESYVGRLEGEVVNATDQVLLGRAVAFQSAYMKEDPNRVFEQVAFNQIGQFGQLLSIRQSDSASPFVAYMAQIACRNLSWKRIRSVKVGGLYPRPAVESGWFTR